MAKVKVQEKREVTIPWTNLAAILRKSSDMFSEEEILNITLVKPKQLLIHLQRKTNGKKEGSDVSQ